MWAVPQVPSVLNIHYTKVPHFGEAQAEVCYDTEDESSGTQCGQQGWNTSQPTLWNFPSSLLTSGALESTT